MASFLKLKMASRGAQSRCYQCCSWPPLCDGFRPDARAEAQLNDVGSDRILGCFPPLRVAKPRATALSAGEGKAGVAEHRLDEAGRDGPTDEKALELFAATSRQELRLGPGLDAFRHDRETESMGQG